jgi:adenine-specific DNA-methyltransferase
VERDVSKPSVDRLLESIDFYRIDVSRKLDTAKRSELGQFLTPSTVARFMASLFEARAGDLRIIDAGAGVGSLTAALVDELCGREPISRSITATAYELDQDLSAYLSSTLGACAARCRERQVGFTAEVVVGDFIRAGVEMLDAGLFSEKRRSFNLAILNPPYRKINADSETRALLRRIGIETSNLYTAFLALVVQLLDGGGELVAITPRSFCNGPYFRPFRELLLTHMSIERIHVYESRDVAFGDDDVLQENVILHAAKRPSRGTVTISSSEDPSDELVTCREVPDTDVVRPDDRERFIHVVTDELGQFVSDRMRSLGGSLAELGVAVSTGRVVDFRAQEHLRAEPSARCAPLIYPAHFTNGFVEWPKKGKKPNAIAENASTRDLLVPAGTYVLVKRFSSKEEPRRVVAALFDPKRVNTERVGFENHLNVYHSEGRGIPVAVARGLVAFLNSTLVDEYFRQFSGHTQVNATDLRKLPYPTLAVLTKMGERIGESLPPQDEIDRIVSEALPTMKSQKSKHDPLLAKRRIDEARLILRGLGLPTQQQNERSALTLLALVDVKPSGRWAKASNPLRGITPMMDFFREHYGKSYAPNSRETVRRQTVHQFLDAGIIVANPDEPQRPVNSGDFVYQIEERALKLIRTFGTARWKQTLEGYLTPPYSPV